VFSGRERHSSSRFHTLGYPQRCIRTATHLYIRNFRPERWPAGTPRKLQRGKPGPEHGGYHDIDGCPTLAHLIRNRTDPVIARFLELATAKRPAEELYDIRKDSGCLVNLAADPKHAELRKSLSKQLVAYLTKTEDPRVVARDTGDIFETYPRYSSLRRFATPPWAESDPKRVPKQAWLEKKRAK
jgi:uncharacterized sulfatase